MIGEGRFHINENLESNTFSNKQFIENNNINLNNNEKLDFINICQVIILNQLLFGNDLSDRLMSSDVSDELLEAVQNSIKEIEELKKNDKDNINEEEQNENNVEINPEEIEEEPRKFPSNEIMGPNIKDKNKKKSNKEININKYQEFDFQKNLRKNENADSGKKVKTKNSNNNLKKVTLVKKETN